MHFSGKTFTCTTIQYKISSYSLSLDFSVLGLRSVFIAFHCPIVDWFSIHLTNFLKRFFIILKIVLELFLEYFRLCMKALHAFSVRYRKIKLEFGIVAGNLWPLPVLCCLVLGLVTHGQGQQMDSFLPLTKDDIYSELLLPEILSHMAMKDDDRSAVNYPDMMEQSFKPRLDMALRSLPAVSLPEDYEFQGPANEDKPSHPSLRDQEFLQHSSLWGHQFVSGGGGELPNRIPPQIKTDANLPAYCNPPNPCPVGYHEEQGCLENFENTAIFSREYQAAQDCTCDHEHMFDCAGSQTAGDQSNDRVMASDLEKFLMHQFQTDNRLENSNTNPTLGVIKKLFHTQDPEDELNPFLAGDKLPIAAKKGLHVEE